jgi:DNA mismatch endonuclease (patch repair protein)
LGYFVVELMTDIFSKEKRSQIMSKIKGKNTGIEKKMLLELKKAKLNGFKYQKRMLGNPDFIFEKQKIAVFCDGDFWHGYGFSRWKNKLNKFWSDKIFCNIKRDKLVRRKLKKEGWSVIRFWEHEIDKDSEGCIQILKFKIRNLNEKTYSN